jgi:casein kinase II subunit beta
METSSTSMDGDTWTWVSWFCNLNGNQAFCEVDKSFIEDSFNLFGLKQFVNKDFNRALLTILDKAGKLCRFVI